MTRKGANFLKRLSYERRARYARSTLQTRLSSAAQERVNTDSSSSNPYTSSQNLSAIRQSSVGAGSPRADNEPQRASLIFGLGDAPGALENALRFFRQRQLDLTRIQSVFDRDEGSVHFEVDLKISPRVDGEKALEALLNDLSTICTDVEICGAQEVPWFPKTVEDVDQLALFVLGAGAELEADHPGFHDKKYRQRRDEITAIAGRHKCGAKPEWVDYTDDEKECWRTVYDRLMPLTDKYACQEHLRHLKIMEEEGVFSNKTVPQLLDINDYCFSRTGFQMRPTAGLLSPRNFLNGLAFRVFFSTQYMRHPSVPFYTPEPDLVHELIGHAPLFADPAFAEFSQEIGLASIGATDEQITALARVYWYTVEFGLCMQDGERKAYGAGVLSSFGEIEYSMGLDLQGFDTPEYVPFDPFVACQYDFPITKYQPTYYVAENFEDAKRRITEFTRSMNKPFTARWNRVRGVIETDRNVNRMEANADDLTGSYSGAT